MKENPLYLKSAGNREAGPGEVVLLFYHDV